MHQLTEAGLTAMAEEMYRLATNGQQSWDQASPQLRADFRGFVDQMVDQARTAEEECIKRQRPTKAVLP